MKPLVLAGALLCFVPSLFSATITVQAGDYDRRDVVVECKLPIGVSGLHATDGGSMAVQHDGSGRAWFILPELKRGDKKVLQFVKANSPNGASAKAAKDSVTLSAFGKTALVYRTEKTS